MRNKFPLKPFIGAAKRFVLAALAYLYILGPITLAQEEGQRVMMDIEFRVGAAGLYEGIHYLVFEDDSFEVGEAGNSDELSIVTRGQSKLYQYTGPSPLVFFRKTGGGEGSRQPVAKLELARIADPSAEQFLYFYPRSEGPLDFGIIPISVNGDRLDTGDIILVNASNSPVAFSTTGGEARGILKSGAKRRIDYEDIPGARLQVRRGDNRSEAEGEGNFDTGKIQLVGLEFASRASPETEWRPLNVDIISAREDEVRVVFFYPPAVEGSHHLRRSVFKLTLPGGEEDSATAGTKD